VTTCTQAVDTTRNGAVRSRIRLTIDARVWKTGIGTYTLNLLAAIRAADPDVRVTSIARAEAVSALSALSHETRIVDIPIYTVREQLDVLAATRGCDLFHVPHYNIPVLYRGPLVVTIHDVAHVKLPPYRNSFKSKLYARPMLRTAGRKASRVIAVSHYTKREIAESLGITPEKIEVIHHGVACAYRAISKCEASERVFAEYKIRRPYLLYVGNLKPHKNLGLLFRALATLRGRGRSHHLLVLAGDDLRCRQSVLEMAKDLGLQDIVVHIPWAHGESLPYLYSAADALIMPSLSESFGLPLVEAMASGTPVISSTAAALPEIGGDAVVYFDPHSVEELIEGIERVLDSPSLQAELRTKGLKRAAKFTWEECARKHVEVYRSVLAQ
jgi:glycosyltransferase involved in cell wall biosynthesis